MFADRWRLFKVSLGLLALPAALFAIGCGGASNSTDSTAAPDIADADAGDVAVISGWVDALRAGDVETAAGYFAQPSIAENGPLVTRIESLRQAIAFNEALPCGAVLTSAETTGDFTTARFELVDRPGADCGPGVGGTAATSFVIEDGKITEWRRVGEPSGGSSGDGAPLSTA